MSFQASPLELLPNRTPSGRAQRVRYERMQPCEDGLPAACSQPSPSPYCSFHLPDDASGTFERGPLWGVHLLHLLELEGIAHIRSLAAAHVSEHGWSTSRHQCWP